VQSPANLIVTSTGIPSLDDILGDGLQLGTNLLVLNPDSHSSHASLLQKYYIAQGLVSGHEVHVFGNDLDCLVDNCMWVPGVTGSTVEEEVQSDDKIKIAWRYERMEKFRTTVSSSSGQYAFRPPLTTSA